MNCKNCGHLIVIRYPNKYLAEKPTGVWKHNKGGGICRERYDQIDNKKCGCTKPEPLRKVNEKI